MSVAVATEVLVIRMRQLAEAGLGTIQRRVPLLVVDDVIVDQVLPPSRDSSIFT